MDIAASSSQWIRKDREWNAHYPAIGEPAARGRFGRQSCVGLSSDQYGALYGFFECGGQLRQQPRLWRQRVVHTRLNGASSKYNPVTLQTAYALSRRTDVYAEAAYQHVGNPGNPGITADIVGVSASSTDTQVVGTVGIRHRF